MWKSIHKIDEGLFICGVAALQPSSRLRQVGICSILNAAQAELYSMGYGCLHDDFEDLPKYFDVRIIGAQDAETCNLSEHFAEIADFMEVGRAKGGVVVHCAAGISRASTSACAYLMIKEHWELNAAFKRIHSVRGFVHPNSGFWRQLRDLEASLKAQGVELRPLPDDWTPCPQPPELEAEASPSPWTWWGAQHNSTEDLIAVLDEEARSCTSFATLHLVAVLEPAEGTAVQDLADQLKAANIGGVRLDDVAVNKDNVAIRAGLVPSLRAESFREILHKLPGVRSVTVEGVPGSA